MSTAKTLITCPECGFNECEERESDPGFGWGVFVGAVLAAASIAAVLLGGIIG